MEKFNIVLTSSGFINTNKRSDKIDSLFKEISKCKDVLLITNATKTGSNLSAKTDVMENFEKVGARIVHSLDIDKSNIQKILDYDVIYGMGGNVRPLIEDLRDCNFREYFINFLKNGIYIGESAGSIILSKDIKWCYDIKKGTKPKYDKGLDSYVGIDVTIRNVYPHYNSTSEEVKQKIKKYEIDNNIKIDCLNDGEFILENYLGEVE